MKPDIIAVLSPSVRSYTNFRRDLDADSVESSKNIEYLCVLTVNDMKYIEFGRKIISAVRLKNWFSHQLDNLHEMQNYCKSNNIQING